MLIQIDVFPDNDVKSLKTLFVSPATVVNRDNQKSEEENKGQLLTVGRKDCDVLFDKEKSVSRKHAVLTLVTNDKRKKGCKLANTEKESKACEESPLGMCLMFENMGKGGSLLIMPDKSCVAGTKQANSNAIDVDATDDETDDEGVSQPISQGANLGIGGTDAMAISAKQFYGNSPVAVTTLDVDHKEILSFRDSKDNTLFIQFGVSPTRPTIRIKWIPLWMVCSSTVSSAIKSKLYLGGAAVMDGMPNESTTHLVAKDYSPVAKQLIAWCRGIPIVSPDFCKAIIDRKEPEEPLPQVKDFQPKMSEADNFFQQTANPKLLSKFTIFSIFPKADDAEQLAEAAGATVVRLHDLFSKDDDILQHVNLKVQEQQKLSNGSPHKTIHAVLAPSSKKGVSTTKISLLNRIEKLGVPASNVKEVARAIAERYSTLRDCNRNVIPGAEENEATDVIEMKAHVESPDALESSKQTKQPEKVEPNNSTDGKMHGNVGKRNGAVEDSETLASHKRGRVDQEPMESTDATESLNDTNIAFKKAAEPTSAHPRYSASISGTNSTLLTSADKDGWFSVAPKDETKRNGFRKKASQALLEEHGTELEPAASTRGFVQVVTPVESTEKADNSTGSAFGRRAHVTNGPNFKRFRKNYIAPADPEDCVVLVDFVSEKTRKVREMTEHAQKLEEEQREADALFRDAGLGAAPKKRRRRD